MKRMVRLSMSARPPTRSITVPSARGVEPVDGEVAPLGVGLPVAAEADLGAAAVGLDVGAQRRHLEGPAGGDQRDRAVLGAGVDDLEAGRRAAPRTSRPASWSWRCRCRRPRRPSSALRTAPPAHARFLAIPASRQASRPGDAGRPSQGARSPSMTAALMRKAFRRACG